MRRYDSLNYIFYFDDINTIGFTLLAFHAWVRAGVCACNRVKNVVYYYI